MGVLSAFHSSHSLALSLFLPQLSSTRHHSSVSFLLLHSSSSSLSFIPPRLIRTSSSSSSTTLGLGLGFWGSAKTEAKKLAKALHHLRLSKHRFITSGCERKMQKWRTPVQKQRKLDWVGSIEAAKRAMGAGVDAIIVQGREAGGHVMGQILSMHHHKHGAEECDSSGKGSGNHGSSESSGSNGGRSTEVAKTAVAATEVLPAINVSGKAISD